MSRSVDITVGVFGVVAGLFGCSMLGIVRFERPAEVLASALVFYVIGRWHEYKYSKVK